MIPPGLVNAPGCGFLGILVTANQSSIRPLAAHCRERGRRSSRERRRYSSLVVLPAVVAAFGLVPLAAAAEETAAPSLAEEIRAGLASSFALPFDDLLVKRHDSEWRNLVDGLSVGVSFNYPLNNDFIAAAVDDDRRVERTTSSPTLNLDLRYRPLGAWFVGGTIYHYLDSGEQQSWNPDFSYSFGYDDWRPYTLSLVYANYGGNRFNPDRNEGERVTRFAQGTWSLGWKFPVPRPLAEPMLVDRTAEIDCQTAANLTPSYYDDASDDNRNWKRTLSLACNYPILAGLSLRWRAFYYTDGDTQQPWDPDFTYGFGYAPAWARGFSVQYDNYSGNRFPWRDRAENTGRFVDGTLSLGWSWQW